MTPEQIKAALAEIHDMKASNEFAYMNWFQDHEPIIDFALRLAEKVLGARPDLVVVPREPTRAMLDAGMKAPVVRRSPSDAAKIIYEAMIGAVK